MRVLPNGCNIFGAGASSLDIPNWIEQWEQDFWNIDALVVLSATRSAELKGISAAGSSACSRRYTALADAELLLNGPSGSKRWPLPHLVRGVSPALISFAATSLMDLDPVFLGVGLYEFPSFPHLRFDLQSDGPASCLSTGKAMSLGRVGNLWHKAFAMGRKMKKPLLLAECVPGGTTTAQAVLTGLGLSVSSLISGSALHPPRAQKIEIVEKGLKAANLGLNPSSKMLISAVGDPFQAVAVGLLIGAREAGQKVLLGGGSQMVAVLALALAELPISDRQTFVEGILLGTTKWLAGENGFRDQTKSSLVSLIDVVGEFFSVELLGISSSLSFEGSRFSLLRDYEDGYVKEGVGAGAFALLAQMRGINCNELLAGCEEALACLQSSSC